MFECVGLCLLILLNTLQKLHKIKSFYCKIRLMLVMWLTAEFIKELWFDSDWLLHDKDNIHRNT